MRPLRPRRMGPHWYWRSGMGPLGFWRTGTGFLSVGILTLLTSATRIPVHRTYTHGSQGQRQTFCHKNFEHIITFEALYH